MGHIIQVELPPEVFEQVAKKAHKNGKTPEQQVADWAQANATSIADEIEEVPPDPNDPLEKLFGTLEGVPPDWAHNHDYYIAEYLAEKKMGIKPAK